MNLLKQKAMNISDFGKQQDDMTRATSSFASKTNCQVKTKMSNQMLRGLYGPYGIFLRYMNAVSYEKR